MLSAPEMRFTGPLKPGLALIGFELSLSRDHLNLARYVFANATSSLVTVTAR
jgi:hypothetical protein